MVMLSRPFQLANQVVGHAHGERCRADEDRDVRRVLRQVDRRLASGVATADDRDLAALHGP